MRYLTPRLEQDLHKKMVLLAGPRQCGKTTLAKSLLDRRGQYLNWDITADRKVIRDLAWPKDASLVVLDELHKAPVDVAESKTFLPGLSLPTRVRRLLRTGGFPEALLNPDEAARLRNDRMEIVTREDLRDLTRITSWRGPADLVELLRERVGQPTNYDHLAQSLGISPPTAKSWVELLEKLYLICLLPPYSSSLSRSIRKDRRIYFFDCAAAYDETEGAQLENLVACCLLKHTQFRKDATGENWGLFYLRDKEGREVDFVVTLNRRIHWLIEVKKSDHDIGSGFKYYLDKLRPKQAWQLVLDLDRPLERHGIKVVRLGEWLEGLAAEAGG